MQSIVDTYLQKFTAITGLILLAGVLIIFILSPKFLPAFLVAYLISFAFTGSNFLVMRKVDLQDQSKFFRIFGWSLAVRFILVITVFIITVKAINNHQIFFTVSFIISYICHSVIEIIFLNKILETDTQ